MASDDDEIPETGAIFTFGKTRFAENLANKFWIRDDKILQLDCGDEHSAVITSSGRLYTFGSNDWGQLGHGNTKPYTKPGVVKKLKGDRVKAVACGRSHTLVISESGVFSFGAGADSQLGHGDNKNYNVPTEIEALSDKTITQVSSGAEHSAALTENGELYVWGSGSEGQLGLGIAECELPSLLKFRSKVSFVACGYYHTAVITELGKLYTFGDNESGQLGLEDNQCEDTEQPQQVKTINEPVVFVACGGNHTAALTKRGSLFTFGSGMHGQLGHGPTFQDMSLPKLVSTLQGKFVSSVSCGESHTAVVTKNGEMYSFGDGRHGKLGMGDESFSNLFQPTKVKRFKKFNVEQVSCGGCHMLAVAARKQGGIEDSEDSEQDVSRVQEDSGGEDVPDGPRLSQTIPMSGMSARDKRRKKDTEGAALASSLPPLNRSLPPLASLGLASMKKEENKPVSNGRLNPLDRSTLPTISIKSPSPDDEESTTGRLANSRRLPPRPKRRQKKMEASSDSEEGGGQKGNTTPRPTPLPRKQKIRTENENNEENGKKFRKDEKFRESMKKSGSEASDEDSENDDDNDKRSSPSSLRRLNEVKESKVSKTRDKKDEDISEEESEDEDDDEGIDEDDGMESKGKEIRKSGKKEIKKKKDGKKETVNEDKKEMQEDEEDEEDGTEDDEEEEESEEENDDEGEKSKGDKGEETEVTKVEAGNSGKDDDEENDKKNDKDSKKGKKDKKKGKTKEDEEAEDKQKDKGKEKKKKDKKKNNQDNDENKEDNEENDDDKNNAEEDSEKDKENDDKNDAKEKDESANKHNQGKKKSGICVIL